MKHKCKLTVMLFFATQLAGCACLSGDPERDQIGRYQIDAAPFTAEFSGWNGYLFKIDTATGEVWSARYKRRKGPLEEWTKLEH